MNNKVTTLIFTTDGHFYCDGLSEARPIRIGGGLLPGEVGCESCPKFTKCGMSHVSTLAKEVKSLAAIEAVCKEKGWTFKRDQKTWKWYGQWVNDYSAADAAYRNGITPEEYGKCDHAIGVPGTDWEIGLVKNKETGGYRLVYDFFGSKGRPLQEAIGKDGSKLLQPYGVAVAKLTAKSKGYYGVQQTTLANGSIKLQIQVG